MENKVEDIKRKAQKDPGKDEIEISLPEYNIIVNSLDFNLYLNNYVGENPASVEIGNILRKLAQIGTRYNSINVSTGNAPKIKIELLPNIIIK